MSATRSIVPAIAWSAATLAAAALVIAWSAATLAAAALVTAGPVLRPGVLVDPSTFAVGLGIALAIAWPFVTRDRVVALFVAMQGTLTLALVGASGDSPASAWIVPAVGWWGIVAIAAGARAWAERRGVATSTLWTAALVTMTVAALGWLGS